MSCGWETSGFNLTLEAYVSGSINAISGLVVNLTDVDRVLKEITDIFDHKHLQKDFPELDFQLLEDFAVYCWDRMIAHDLVKEWACTFISLEKIRLYHSPTQWMEILA